MNSTRASSDGQSANLHAFPALRQSYRRGDRARALSETLRALDAEDERERLDGLVRTDALGPLEQKTRSFRWLLQRKYQRRARDVRGTLRAAKESYFLAANEGDRNKVAEVIRGLVSSARWYAGRAAAQPVRFDSIRACGSRVIKVACRVDAEPLCAMPCRCGIVRRCDACAEHVARKRQRRISGARVAVIARGHRSGLFFPRRAGGAFTEKMLTLTVPHFELADASGKLLAACSGFGLETTVNARISALRLAWPKFMRRVRRWFTTRRTDPAYRFASAKDADALKVYRLLEWTRGHDGQGHPHFHVYVFAPWLPVALLRRWWAASLVEIGAPLPTSCTACRAGGACSFAMGEPHVTLDLRSLDGFSWAALKELIKTGDRRAIELRMGSFATGGEAAIKYASGWTMGDAFGELPDASTLDVQRDLYCALEGRRLAQGSRGFLAPPVRPICACCGQSMFAAALVDPCVASDVGPSDPATSVHVGAGPPAGWGS